MGSEAWATYGDPAHVPKVGDVSGAALAFMRIMSPNPDTTLSPASTAECTVDTALEAQQREALHRIIGFGPTLDRDMPVVRQLKAKYGVGPNERLDPNKMDPEDAQTVQRINTEMQPAFREQQLAFDFANIRSWWSAAKLVYRTRREDIETYGAVVTSMGKTLRARIGGLDQPTPAMIGLWFKVNQMMPSFDAKMLAAVTDTLKRSGGIR